jgi:hypothetical protein
MPLGPIELIVVSFPGNKFKGEIIPALRELVDNKTIRIIDFVFVTKDTNGEVSAIELSDFDSETYELFEPLISRDTGGLLSKSDIDSLAHTLANNSSAGLMLFEDVWATRFRDSLVNADAALVLAERIPRKTIETLAEEAKETVRA